MVTPRRIDRIFPGIGGDHRIAIASGCSTKTERDKRDAMLTRLYDTGRYDLLRAIKRGPKGGGLSIGEVYAADREGKLGFLLADLMLRRTLAEEIEQWLPKSAPAPKTRERYGCSWKQLERTGVLRPGAKVADLSGVDWVALKAAWVGGPHDWKHLRGFVSHFLSHVTGDLFHPFRREIVKAIPRARPQGRVPDMTPDAFWRVVRKMPEYTRAVPVAILATGMRIGELCARTADDLLPLTKSVRIVGNKPPFKVVVQPVDARFWSWVTRAIPVTLSHFTIRDHWRAAQKAAGFDASVTMHDIRHLGPQWMVNEGVPEEAVQRWLRHETAASTRIYTTQKSRTGMAKTLANVALREKKRSKKA